MRTNLNSVKFLKKINNNLSCISFDEDNENNNQRLRKEYFPNYERFL